MPENEDLDVSEIREAEEASEDEDGSLRFGDIYIPPPPKQISAENAGPRLMITHIENENFKSYAGKKILGPFHKNFTAIVGPNGSGKSNVIDSMLFVFGYRASKIRSKKICVLLHNSANHQNVQSCTVAVHFQEILDKPGDDFEVVPNSKIVIARTAFRDNTSYYTINGKRVQFKEVAKLLRGYGIDLDHNRFLILQGEVEQISMMKPKAPNEHESGMLEYLEDIIGTTRYKEPLVKLSELVEQLIVERTEKLNRVKIVEKEKDNLEGPMKEAVSFLKKENELAQLRNIHFQTYIHEHDQKLQEYENHKTSIEESIGDVVEKLKEFHQTTEAKNQELKAASREIDEVTKNKESLTEQFNKANQRHVVITADMTQLNKKRKKTKELLAEEKKKLSELENIPEKNEKEIKDLKVHMEKLNKEREKQEQDLEKVMSSMRKETKGLQESKEKLQTELIDLKKAVDESKSVYDISQSELELYVSSEHKEKAKLEQLQKNFEAASKSASSRKGEIDALKTAIPETEKQLQQAQEELLQVRQEEATVSAALQQQRAEVEEARSSMQATRSQNRVLDSLMQQKQNGNLPGIFGRLGDLGAIDQKYDVAVSTACGPLDNIVVDTVDTAQRCIDFLKKHDIGRATFIALEKQEHLRQKYSFPINPPEGVPRLFDLIRVADDRVRPAFYYGLRDTLVANDLDQATRIAYQRQRYRVVTLAGELIEIAGTMSGGGKKVLRGRMGQSVAVNTNTATPKKLGQMERKLEDLESRASHLRTKQVMLEDRVANLSQQLQTMKMDLNKFTMEIKFSADQVPVLQEQLQKQQQKVKAATPDPQKVKQLTAAVNKAKIAYDAALESANKVDAEVQKLHKEIMSKTSGRIKAAQKKLDEVTKNIDKVAQEITRLEVAIRTSKRNSKKSEEKIQNMEQEIQDSEKRILELQEERTKIEADGQVMIGEIKKFADIVVEKDKLVMTLKQELSAIQKEENKLKAEKMEVDQKIDDIKKKIQECKAKISAARDKLKKLSLHAIPGQETPGELRTLTPEELAEVSLKELQYKITAQESSLANMKPNLSAIQEYKQKENIYLQRVADLEEATQRRNEMKKNFEMARKNRYNEFMRGFSTITHKLKEMYQMITLGGDAELELVDSLDPFTEGINFSVRPPKKTWKLISNLSGGEKTLSSLALVFALHYYKPTPLYVMDEIDAALDFKNVSIVGHYIKERTKNAQFIIISLRSNMFELADRLVGIYKVFNCTNSITVDPRAFGMQGTANNLLMIQAPQASQSSPPGSNEDDEPRRRKIPKSRGNSVDNMETQSKENSEPNAL